MLELMTNSQQHLMGALDGIEVKYGWETLDHLAAVVTHLAFKVGLANTDAKAADFDALVKRILDQKEFYKHQYMEHLSTTSEVGQHCRQHGLGIDEPAPEEGSWEFACFPKCDHTHVLSCDQCFEYQIIYQEIENIVLQV